MFYIFYFSLHLSVDLAVKVLDIKLTEKSDYVILIITYFIPIIVKLHYHLSTLANQRCIFYLPVVTFNKRVKYLVEQQMLFVWVCYWLLMKNCPDNFFLDSFWLLLSSYLFMLNGLLCARMMYNKDRNWKLAFVFTMLLIWSKGQPHTQLKI